MNNCRTQFDLRVREVDLFLMFIEQIVERSGKLHFDKKRTWKSREVEEDVQRVLKAGVFLMLYNLAESTIRAAFAEVFETLRRSGVSYRQAHQLVQKLWVREKFLPLERSSAQPSSYRSQAMEIIGLVLRDAVVDFNIENLPLGGNVDARKIRDLADQFGISHKTDRRTRGGEKLELVKKLRNALAHGDISFSECGRDYTVKQLREIRTQVVWYLRGMVNNTERYLRQSRFKAA